jgi:hypothetical protein
MPARGAARPALSSSKIVPCSVAVTSSAWMAEPTEETVSSRPQKVPRRPRKMRRPIR